jgi:phenylacetate-CoA ligase
MRMTEPPNEPIEQVYERFAALLARTEWAMREELDAYRNALLEKLVSFAYAHSPFYRARLDPLFRNGAKPDLARWLEIPILTRADLVREAERINPSFVPHELGPMVDVITSGTTGGGLSFRNTALARVATGCVMQRLYRWNGFDLTAPLGSIRTYRSDEYRYPEGVAELRWSYPGPQAPHYAVDVRTSIANLIEWLERRRPTYLLTYPSIMHELACHPDAERVRRIGLKHVIAISEIVSPDARVAVRTRFGCEITQFYGCAETGCIAAQSPADEACLASEEIVLVEIVDEAGKPVAAGETGRVLLTSFYNYATPFIRYAIGDFATLAPEPCPSGRTLMRLLRVEGRTRNALRSANGRLIWPNAVVTEAFLDAMRAPQFQLRQAEVGQIEALFVDDRANGAPDAGRLTDYFNALLGTPVDLTLTAVDRLPRSDAGKFERIISRA